MAQSTLNAPSTSRGTRLRSRALAVLGATVAAAAVWLVAVPLLDVDLRAPGGGDPDVLHEIGLVNVVFAAVVSSLAGWGLLAVLEKFLARGRTVWTVIAGVVLVLSVVSPVLNGALPAAVRITIVLLHVAVGAVVIPLLARTSPAR
jgi:hypothetical protein